MPPCPDCDVPMQEADHRASTPGERIRIDATGGILGALNLKGSYLTCDVCPECGLARFYAE
ncbi:hypothetical protein NDI56_07035 [Haloarcula sp. S1CR25-12]|uniref:Nucleic acid-binding protein n=1 Tax=Haloarcula saliterrae TaxID=2950534 RepID=A0ABU2FA71_9EURY|nr:hypothetical protein [Haloarcula sp. S1CR25-12]MDS0259144.1 hypothetical protein [Haloarcula sp. S1CR25-12]